MSRATAYLLLFGDLEQAGRILVIMLLLGGAVLLIYVVVSWTLMSWRAVKHIVIKPPEAPLRDE